MRYEGLSFENHPASARLALLPADAHLLGHRERYVNVINGLWRQWEIETFGDKELP